jgi:hypothetical protein
MCPFVLQILAFVNRVRDIDSNVDMASFTLEDVESNMVRCPDQEAAQKMIDGEHARVLWCYVPLQGVRALGCMCVW